MALVYRATVQETQINGEEVLSYIFTIDCTNFLAIFIKLKNILNFYRILEIGELNKYSTYHFINFPLVFYFLLLSYVLPDCIVLFFYHYFFLLLFLNFLNE